MLMALKLRRAKCPKLLFFLTFSLICTCVAEEQEMQQDDYTKIFLSIIIKLTIQFIGLQVFLMKNAQIYN